MGVPMPPKKKNSGLGGFFASVRDLDRVWALLAAASVPPVVVSLADIAPPWPASIPVLTAIVNLLGIILSHQLYREARPTLVSWSLVATCLMLFVLSAVHLSLVSQMTVAAPVAGEVIVKGFACTAKARISYGARCPWLGESELAAMGWTPTLLWTSWSITLTRVLLAVTWLASFFCLSLFLSIFVVHQRRPLERSPT